MIARTRTVFHIGALTALLGISALAMATSAEAYGGHRGIEDSGGHDASHGGGGMYGGGTSSGGGWGSSHGGGWGMASGGSSGTGGWSGMSGHGHSGSGGDDHHHHHHPIGVLPFFPGQFSSQGGSGYSSDEGSYGYSGACPYPYQPAYLTYGRTVCVTP